jgi:hypothetical protein
MTDQNLSLENGIKMTVELHALADIKITEEVAESIWNDFSTDEQIHVTNEYARLIKKSKHV